MKIPNNFNKKKESKTVGIENVKRTAKWGRMSKERKRGGQTEKKTMWAIRWINRKRMRAREIASVRKKKPPNSKNKISNHSLVQLIGIYISTHINPFRFRTKATIYFNACVCNFLISFLQFRFYFLFYIYFFFV